MEGTMTDKFKVTFEDSTTDTVTLNVKITDINIDMSSTIIVNIYKAQSASNDKSLSATGLEYKKYGNVLLQAPFDEAYTFEDLEPESTYKFNLFLTTRTETYLAIVVCGTKIDVNRKTKTVKSSSTLLKEPDSHLSKTEKLLFHYANVQNHGLGIYDGRKDIHKSILDARVSNKWDNYTNSNYKFCKPKFNRELRKKRTWLVAQGIELYDDIYGMRNNPPGLKMLENDWFMGPFYSYDPNFEKLKKVQ